MADKKLKHTRRIEVALYRVEQDEYGFPSKPTEESFKALSMVPAPLYREEIRGVLDEIDKEIEEFANEYPLTKRLNELRKIGDDEALQAFYNDNKEELEKQTSSVIRERKNLDVTHTLRLAKAFIDVDAGYLKDADRDAVSTDIDSGFWQCQDLEGLAEFIERFRKAIRV